MKKFLDQNFLLETKTAEKLYHDFAEELPIIDYHCHLPVQQIADDINFENLTQVWLYGDHYKWRAMRTNGINEGYCTGNKTDFQNLKAVIPPSAIVEKFEEICYPIDQMIENNEKESRTLGSLRDSLLPKLMRGEVRVKEDLIPEKKEKA